MTYMCKLILRQGDPSRNIDVVLPLMRDSLAMGDSGGGMDFIVPVQSATFLFRTVDGMSFEDTLSLHLNAETHQGIETVLERLNDPNLFLALRVRGERAVVFLNKSQ